MAKKNATTNKNSSCYNNNCHQIMEVASKYKVKPKKLLELRNRRHLAKSIRTYVL